MFQPIYTPPLSQKMAANYLKMLNREQMERLAKLNPKLAKSLRQTEAICEGAEIVGHLASHLLNH